MLSCEGNAGERWKPTIGLISKKATLDVQHIFFCTFLCRCFARLQRETSTNFLVTRFMEEMSYVFSLTFFSLPLIFTLHWWPLAFLILSPPLQNFHVVLPTKKCLLCFLSRMNEWMNKKSWMRGQTCSLEYIISLALDLCRPFSRWASLACRLLSLFLCLSLALYSKFVDMTIYLSLIL